MLDLAHPLGEKPGNSATFGFDCPDEGQAATICQPRRRSWCVDADAAEALAGTNVIEAADLTQNAVNDVVDTLADTTVFPTVFTDRTPSTCPRCLGPTRCTTPSPRTRGPRLNRSLTTSAILAAAGATLTDVVRVGIVMRDLQRDRPAFNQVWAERFGEHRPARSAIQAPAAKARTPGS